MPKEIDRDEAHRGGRGGDPPTLVERWSKEPPFGLTEDGAPEVRPQPRPDMLPPSRRPK